MNKKKRTPKLAKTSEYYVDNKLFYQKIVERKLLIKIAQEQGLPIPKISDYLGECLYKIVTRFATRYNWIRYSYIEEMIGDALENVILYFDKFDPDKFNNPHAYFTKITEFAFIRRISKEKKQKYTQYKYFLSTDLSMDLNESEMFSDQVGDFMFQKENLFENLNLFVDNYEQKELEKKEKAIKQKEIENGKIDSKDQ